MIGPNRIRGRYLRDGRVSGISFVHDMNGFEYGRVDRLSPLIRRVVANNPGGFTFTGTGTYLVGNGAVAVIDPGPRDEAHVQAILEALEPGETISHILITHTHMDHSPATALLQPQCNAPSYGYGPHGGGAPDVEVEEGGDRLFVPDHVLRDGDVIEGGDWTVEAVHTPGHTSNHLCFALNEEKVLFTGDHVMGWSTSVISPPDGNMADYMASLEKLLTRNDGTYWPTHGPAITEPRKFVRGFITHRAMRDGQILKCLDDGIDTIPAMVEIMYATVDKRLHPAAARSVLAHMIRLVDQGRVETNGTPDLKAHYRKAS